MTLAGQVFPIMSGVATATPMNCITMNIGADDGLMPANVSESVRAMVTAGLANDVDEVKKYAPPIHAPTANGTALARPDRTMP